MAEETKKKKTKKKKKKSLEVKISWKKIGIGLAVFFIGGLYYFGIQPIIITGSQYFGVCRTYVELNVQFPSELRFIDVRERIKKEGMLVEVEYMTYDSYGQHLANRGSCFFKRNEQQQVYLDSFRLKRGVSARKYLFAIEDPEKIKSFNNTVPFLLTSTIDLQVRGPARSLGSLSPVQ